MIPGHVVGFRQNCCKTALAQIDGIDVLLRYRKEEAQERASTSLVVAARQPKASGSHMSAQLRLTSDVTCCCWASCCLRVCLFLISARARWGGRFWSPMVINILVLE